MVSPILGINILLSIIINTGRVKKEGIKFAKVLTLNNLANFYFNDG